MIAAVNISDFFGQQEETRARQRVLPLFQRSTLNAQLSTFNFQLPLNGGLR